MRFYRPKIFVFAEQPTSSWLYKQTCWREVFERWGLAKTLTYMGFFGSDLLKGSHILTNFCVKTVARKATAAQKEKHRRRVEKKNRRLIKAGKKPLEYWRRTSDGKFHGCKDLAKTAVYPWRFVHAVYLCWTRAFSEACFEMLWCFLMFLWIRLDQNLSPYQVMLCYAFMVRCNETAVRLAGRYTCQYMPVHLDEKMLLICGLECAMSCSYCDGFWSFPKPNPDYILDGYFDFVWFCCVVFLRCIAVQMCTEYRRDPCKVASLFSPDDIHWYPT